eukprot:351148-Prymnesium_polylepis.1
MHDPTWPEGRTNLSPHVCVPRTVRFPYSSNILTNLSGFSHVRCAQRRRRGWLDCTSRARFSWLHGGGGALYADVRADNAP